MKLSCIARRIVRSVRRLALWCHPFRYVLSALHDSIAAQVKSFGLGPRARVLDYGCGGQPYRDLLPATCDYVGADIGDNPRARLRIGTDGILPAADESFDLVLSTQVLEHVDDPAIYLAECHRVLRPGGRLLLTTHGLMFFHPVPKDLWRWTADGLDLAVRRAGLTVRSREGVVGLIPSSLWLVMFVYQERLPWGVRHAFVCAGNVLMLIFDSMTSNASRLRNACIYNVVAEKPG